MIERTFSVRDKDTLLQLYKSMVRPYLEYSVQAWRPHFQKDIDLIDGVQRIATKLITSVKDRRHTKKVYDFYIYKHLTRIVRGDLIEVFEMFKGSENIDPCMLE